MAEVLSMSQSNHARSPSIPRDESVRALRSLLAVPRVIESPPTVTSVGKSQSPVVSKSPSPPLSSGAVKSTTRTKKKKKQAHPDTTSFYAGSAFQNSPDPVSIPLPVFDENIGELQSSLNFDNEGHSPPDKTVMLRRLLNVKH
mmetsp:Transcript_19911/g.28625  ORF Transcript_19911/g.28625 Transcript_19911/m.28625 type:complete len:143 (-) Transcript_19911:443-871(-)|eukprot:CAMPEP_0185023380 /NCGR_PEP_ID=MMETSP1103-20130426/6059_1 /TAXON_ID=36769 /ORGANISM="Paraphysomonas bandaiensis, Strain Caron Lab Isolate" /LENGTH=142 /DNA_ID=CAMNT_0027555947 /DNA_START=87 /DNA_END=515 /DNA_ORIENTATION=-